MIKRSEILPALLGLAIAAIISIVGYMWSRDVPVEHYDRAVSKLQIVAGDRVTVTWREERDDECDTLVRRRLISADKKVTEFETVRNPVRPTGETLYTEFSFIAPPGLANGPLTYRVSVDFRCNIVQRLLGGPTLVLPDIVFDYKRGTT